MSKINLAIVYGGQSVEHEVSIQSATSIINEIDRHHYHLLPIGLDKTGQWWLNELNTVDPKVGQTLCVRSKTAQMIAPLEFFSKLPPGSVVFPMVHGTNGEDGILQSLFELSNIAYVGNRVLTSAIAMDKDIAKRLVLANDILCVPYEYFILAQWQQEQEVIINNLVNRFGFPMFVKPANTGSSVGIDKVKDEIALIVAINDAFRYDVKVLVEQAIHGHEIELAVLENLNHDGPPLTSVPGEIKTSYDFYSYEAKYEDDSVELIIPAKLTITQIHQLQNTAAEIFTTLGCQGLARVDFFIEHETQNIYFNELNTLPGFTQISMFPLLWQKSGLAYPKMLDQLITLAQQRHQRERRLIRSYSQ